MSLSLDLLALCSLCGICSQCHPGHISTPSVPGSSAKAHPSQSDSVPFVVAEVPGAMEVTVTSLASTTAPRPWLLAVVWYAALPRVEGTETSPGTEAQPLWWLLSREDIIIFSNGILFQIRTARYSGLCQEHLGHPPQCASQVGRHLYTCTHIHTLICEHTHTLSHTQLNFQVDCSVV